MEGLAAQWFDGRSAQAHAVQLRWRAGELLIEQPDGAVRCVPARDIVWPEHTRHGQRQVLLPDGGVIRVADAQAWDRWASGCGIAQPLIASWALSWRGAWLALLLLLAVTASAWRWGIPLAARELSALAPPALQLQLGEGLLKELGDRGWIKPSQLPPSQQQRIVQAAQAMVASAYSGRDEPSWRLHLRAAPDWLGPNAFALPSGDVVVTDALVDLLQVSDTADIDATLLGVIAHELGHVQHRHGLRMLLEAGASSALLGWWIGDYSSLLALAPTMLLQAGYSRNHEREADAEAVRIMRASGIDPRAMVRFFALLKHKNPKRDTDSEHFGLASHPADSERVRFFEGQGGELVGRP